MTFSKVASLNGVHMFLKSQCIELLNTELPDATLVWKEFSESVTLIAAASGTTKYILRKFVEAVFSAMVLIAGMDEIKNLRNIERLKRDLRASNFIIDKLLDCLDIGDRSSSRIDFINMTDCILCPENHLLQAGTATDRYLNICIRIHIPICIIIKCAGTIHHCVTIPCEQSLVDLISYYFLGPQQSFSL